MLCCGGLDMNLSEICEKYSAEKITKSDYAVRLFQKYEELYDYKSLLSKSETSEIIINSDGVFFKIAQKDSRNQEYFILMKLWDMDVAQVPAAITSFGSYEKKELEMVKNLLDYLPKNSVRFDVGANYGWYSLNIKIQRPDIEVYSFEPIAETYNKMKYNYKINGVDINSYNYGLYNNNESVEFFYDIVASGASSMRDLRELDTTVRTTCHMRKLDDFFYEEQVQGLDLIKCDVEGSELFVYKGGETCISKYRPIVYSEMLRKWSAKFNYHPNDIIKLFYNIGYSCYVLNGKEGLKKIEKVTDDTIETNYFFLHNDKHKIIIKDFVTD